MKFLFNTPRRLVVSAALGLAVIGAGALFMFQGSVHAQHMKAGQHGHGADGMGHDMVNMPGLRGENASEEESAELAVLFNNFKTLSREVENLPNGIRSVTRSSDPDVMDALVSHTVGMIDRVGAKDDPQIIIQSKTLDIFFMRGERILSDIEMSDEGIIVTQTSDDPEIVKALHIHAAEVTDMVERGMQAVHEKMMKQSGS